MAYRKQGALVERVNTTATSGGTLTLVVSSATFQQLTGTQTHTVVLPAANTGPIGQKFTILNRSTGVVTVNYNGGSLAISLAAGAQTTLRVVDNSTAPGTWDITNEAGTGGGSSATLDDDQRFALLAAVANSKYEDAQAVGTQIKVNPEEISGNYWAIKTPVSVAKCWPTCFTLNGFVYYAFGITNTPTNVTTNERYNIDNNYFLSRASGITAANTRAPFVLDGYAYAVNGDPSINAVERYDDVLNSWSSRTPIGIAFYGASSWALGDYGYIAGGTGGGGSLTTAYEAVANAWYTRAPLPVSTLRTGQGDGAYNGFGYVISGTAVTTVRKYDQSANSYSSVGSTSVGHAMGGVSAVNGSLIVSGGENTSGTAITTVEKFSDISNAWSSAAPISAARYGCGPQSAGQFMHISNGVGTGTAITTVEAYHSTSFFSIPILKKTLSIPVSIFAAAALNGVVGAVPARLRTDGGTWKYFEANKDSVLNLGESLSEKFFKVGTYEIMGGDSAANTPIAGNYNFNETTNSWATRTALTTARIQPGSFNIEGITHIASGMGSSFTPLTDVVAFSDLTNAFTAKASLSIAKRAPGNFELLGKGYIIGGDDGTVAYDTNLQYTAGTNSWLAKTALPVIKTQMGSFAINGRGHVCNAGTTYSSGSVSTDNYQYDPILDAWSTRTATGTARTATNGMMNREAGMAYVVCGSIAGFDGIGGTVSALNEKYDPAANSWSTAQACTFAREATAASVSGIGNLIVGGRLAGVSTRADQVDLFNPYSNAWSTKALVPAASRGATTNSAPGNYYNYELQIGLPTYLSAAGGGQWIARASYTGTGRGNSKGGVLQGQAYYVGGNTAAPAFLAEVDKYNDEEDRWTSSTRMNTGRNSLSVFVVGGLMYAAGGETALGPTITNVTEQYDPISSVWSSRAVIGTTSSYSIGTSLNGFGYKIAGRTASGVYTGVVEKYNQSTNSWSAATSVTSRFGPCATVANGYIYTVGGFNGASLSVNEEYSDAANTWTSKANVANMNRNHSYMAVFLGRPTITGGGSTTVCESYDIGSNAWIVKPTAIAPTTSTGGAAYNLGDSMFIAGTDSGTFNNNQKLVPAIKNIVLGAALRVE